MTNVAKKKEFPAFLVLTIIALVAAVVLALTNEVTKGPIAEHANRARTEAFNAVLPAASYEEAEIPAGHDSVSALFKAKDESGADVGYTVVASASGYAGPVAVTLGVDPQGMVTGAVIGDTSFAETAGFGMRWKEETNRWEQFKSIDTANGGSIEAISGATVTSNAVLNATNAGVNCVNEVRGVSARDVVAKGAPAAKPIETVTLTGDIHEGSAPGYLGAEVRVQLTMDDANVVTGLAIDSTSQTPGFGTRAMEEPEFAKQFEGQSAPFELGKNIDGLSGATITSQAVVEAVNAACAAPANPDAVPFDLGGKEEEPSVETSAKPVPAGARTAAAPGFVGEDVRVTLTLDESGAIATLDIDVSDQVPPACDLVLADSFVNQFIGKTGPFVKGENVDIVSGATFTSDGVINAVNAALEAPAAEASDAEVLKSSAVGFVGEDVRVNVTLDAEGAIATLEIDVSDQVPPACDLVLAEEFVNQFVGKKGPFVKGENVDGVTGATFTSDGVIAALNKLFPAEEAVEEAPAAEVLKSSAVGFVGEDVRVNVTLDAEGAIATLDIDVSDQVPPACDLVLADSFVNQFVGKKGPFVKGENVDGVTGATFTSDGVIAALNKLFPAEEAVEEAPAAEVLKSSAV
ncbi:MAG: FMN-binding protein, partial [Clostridia bacterium]|nr:FMN-binding protein [Clostridia bacterium]